MRIPRRAWPLVLLMMVQGARGSADPAPRPFQAAMRAEPCDSVTWTRVSSETWFALCDVVDRTPEGRKLGAAAHKGFLLHHAARAPRLDKLPLVDWESRRAIKGGDVDMDGAVEVRGARLTRRSTGWSGEVRREVWDLSAYPPRLVEITRGGALVWSRGDAPAYPLCTTDMGRRRESCEWARPDCADASLERGGDVPWAGGETVRFRAIPLLSYPTRDDIPSDPFTCATTIGGDKVDVYFGKNPGQTTFEAVADNDDRDDAHRKLVLYLRAHDRSPAPPDKDGVWQGADHWEIWLGAAGTVDAHFRDDKKGYCAARFRDHMQLIVAPHRDGTIEVVNGMRRTKVVPAHATARLGEDGEVVVELTGELYRWGVSGAITVAYSDSLDGKRQDTIIGSSRVAWARPETFGRLGHDALCRAGKLPRVVSLPWN